MAIRLTMVGAGPCVVGTQRFATCRHLLQPHLVCGLVLLISAPSVVADYSLVLTKTFVNAYKDRATIETDCVVDMAHKTPNSPIKDRDLHVAVRCKEVGLAAVAEIMNAKDYPPAIDAIHATEGSTKEINLAGAWRLWAEHGGKDITHSQLNPPTTRFDDTNPDHLFEIHPVSRIGVIDIAQSFKPIFDRSVPADKQFKPRDAQTAFQYYENKSFRIRPLKKVVELRSSAGGANYVKFVLRLLKPPEELKDGYRPYASIHDEEGETLVHELRTVFVADTPPAERVKKARTGECLTVLGMPRISLVGISQRLRKAAARPEALTWSVPYEMIIVAVYPGCPELG